MRFAIDTLMDSIEALHNPTVAGLDTRLEYLPEGFVSEVCGGPAATMELAAKAITAYNERVIGTLRGIVPAVKVQVAYYEMYGLPGMRAFADTLAMAASAGMTVIADVKRSDIGATAAAYSAAYLGETALANGSARAFPCDMVTINPYLGFDGVKPFLEDITRHGGGAFALVKTSNPSSGELQDVMAGERAVYETVADMVNLWGAKLIGERGYSALGAVVGATYPEQGRSLRARMPRCFFLVPGYGAQGATAADLRGCFDESGRGAIVNNSRGLLCAWQKRPGVDFAQAARDEALRMREDIMGALR